MMSIDTMYFGDGVKAKGGRFFLWNVATYIWEHSAGYSALQEVLKMEQRDVWRATGWYALDKLAYEDYVRMEQLVLDYRSRYGELRGDQSAEIQEDELRRLDGIIACLRMKLARSGPSSTAADAGQ